MLTNKEAQYQALIASAEIIIGNGNDISNTEYLKSNAEDHLKLAEHIMMQNLNTKPLMLIQFI